MGISPKVFLVKKTLSFMGISVGDMPESPSSQYGLKAQEDIDPKRD
jgi:hypothetical protein